MTSDLWLNQLQHNGYRLTDARRAVVELVASARRALSPLEVYDMARGRHPALGLVTVYRTLEKLDINTMNVGASNSDGINGNIWIG